MKSNSSHTTTPSHKLSEIAKQLLNQSRSDFNAKFKQLKQLTLTHDKASRLSVHQLAWKREGQTLNKQLKQWEEELNKDYQTVKLCADENNTSELSCKEKESDEEEDILRVMTVVIIVEEKVGEEDNS